MKKLLKKLHETPPNSDYAKALDIHTNLEVGRNTTIEIENIQSFRCYLASMSKLKPLRTGHKTFSTRLKGNSITIWCLSDQATL